MGRALNYDIGKSEPVRFFTGNSNFKFWLHVRDTNWHLSLLVTSKSELLLAFNFLVCFGLSGREAGRQNVCPGVKHSQTQPVIAGSYLGEETGTGS